MPCAAAVQSIRVLLVDDHRSMLWGLEKLIQSAAPHMEVVESVIRGADALAAVGRHKPDVVLLDLNLGDENGLHLVPQIRKLGPKVVILTGFFDAVLERRAIVAGASGLVHKSEPADVILRAIQHVQKGELWLDRGTTAKIFGTFVDMTNRVGEQTLPGEKMLTTSERKIIATVTAYRGAPNKVIANDLCISSHTLRNHLASIYSKLGMHHRLDLVLYAMENGLDKPAQSAALCAST
jgi:two-component system nitrate/nitrite response regulator NarL